MRARQRFDASSHRGGRISPSTGNCNHISSSYDEHPKWPTVCGNRFAILESSNYFVGSNGWPQAGWASATMWPKHRWCSGTSLPPRPGCVGVGHQRLTAGSPHPPGEQELSTGTQTWIMLRYEFHLDYKAARQQCLRGVGRRLSTKLAATKMGIRVRPLALTAYCQRHTVIHLGLRSPEYLSR